jgi:hypothetical protein
MTKPDGGPAFPVIEQWNEWSELKADYVSRTGPRGGMSLRDFFAGQALPAVIEAYIAANGSCLGADHIRRNAPAHAYAFADAMLTEREKE